MGKGKHLKIDQIAAIAALYQAGHKNLEISTQTGINLRTVQSWTKKYRESPNGDVQLQKKQPGRPKLTGPRTLNILKRQVDIEPSVSARQLKERNTALLSTVSIRTIQRRLHVDLEFRRRVAKKKPMITARQQRNRLQFAKEKIRWNNKKWRKTLFSDEATFTVTGNRPTMVRRRPGSDPYEARYICPTVKQPDRLMVWGAIGYSGPGVLITLPRNLTMNSRRYRELLRRNLYDCLKKCRISRKAAIFQQDGATCHTAHIIGNYLDSINIKYIKPWPGNSPDLNPIEHVWAEMKRLLQGRDTSSIPKLEAEIHNIWQNLDRDYLKTLIDSVPDRLQAVIDSKGKNTKY